MILRCDDIFEAVEALPEFREASTVLAFWAVRDEPRTQEFIARWHGRKRIALPVVVDDTQMILREYDPELMRMGRFGIMEPSEEALEVHPSEIDFAIVPGQAFDADGRRKGHGKGYYDRFLPSLHCFKVGVAHAGRIVGHIDARPWDVSVELVITEK
ncbi:MAG: 5-formyltetrahydrofolate cyclo-ligase [Bacteroidales bacterium]|nr:5-formyltetrahydrofolate cyclo-ligase [Bacteroidales bacterium]